MHFYVEDSGIGIPAEKIEKIFESFTQADGSTTRKYGGTGLGTSISKMLVELMGGKIWVESPNPNLTPSEAHPGSVFHFTLPFKEDKHQSELRYKKRLEGINAILFDEDDSKLLLVKRMLQNWGIDAQVVNTSEDLEEMLKINPDTHLLITTNYFYANHIKKKGLSSFKKLAPDIKTILLTLESRAASSPELKEFDRIVFKPVKHSTLFTTIYDLFNYSHEKEVIHLKSDKILNQAIFNKRVLLVEDNPINQKIAEKMLSKLHFKVVLAENGQEAVDLIKKGDIDVDLVLMDIQMPILNGLDATRQLREIGFFRPIVAMTANVLKGDREVCMDAGMNDYIGKPVKIEVLKETLSRWLKSEPLIK